MRSKSSKYNARKTVVDGIKFDSIYESQVYQKLKFISHGNSIRPHARAAYLGNDDSDRNFCISNLYWRVDFMIQNAQNKPLFAIEAKGRFLQADKFKFLLWQLYQDIPLIVVHSENKKPKNLHSSDLVHFIPWGEFSLMSSSTLTSLVRLIRNRCK